MSNKLRIAEQHYAVAGQKNPKHISVSMDGRYNAHGFKSSYKPGQSSSQADSSHGECNKGKIHYWACHGNQIVLDWGLATEPWFYYALVGMLGLHPQSHIYNHIQKEGYGRIFHWKISGSGPSLLMETQSFTLVCRISTTSSVQPGQFLTS